MHSRPAASALVYSTDGGGRMCPACRQAASACRCGDTPVAIPRPGRIQVVLAQRNGKTVTVVRGLPLPPDEVLALGKTLRTRCGCGGTVREGVVELQGDQRVPVSDFLRQRGLMSATG